MTIEQQIQWAEKQLRYSEMIGDGDADKWKSVLNSLNRLHKLTTSATKGAIEDIIYNNIELDAYGSINGKWDAIEAIWKVLDNTK